MKLDRQVVIVAVAIVIAGIAFSKLPPVNPKPQRPVLKFLAKVAKLGLWVMLAHSSPLAGEQRYAHTHTTDESGERVLDSGKGW